MLCEIILNKKCICCYCHNYTKLSSWGTTAVLFSIFATICRFFVGKYYHFCLRKIERMF